MTTDDKTFYKDPQDVLDYVIDYDDEDWLGSDTIATSSWAVTGVVLDSDSNTTTTATAWLSGGTAGTNGTATNTITTTAGRTKEVSLYFVIKEN